MTSISLTFESNEDMIRTLKPIMPIDKIRELLDQNRELPKSVSYTIKDKKLTFDTSFNEPLDNFVWPTNIKTIVFNHEFNHPVNNLLPEYVETIAFGASFNQLVDHLPVGLKRVAFMGNNLRDSVDESKFNQSIDKLPQGLTHLGFDGKYDGSLDKLPQGLTYLNVHCSSSIPKLPSTLTTLICGYNWYKVFPQLKKLTKLILTGCFSEQITIWPSKLTHLTLLENAYIHNLINLPASLTYLKIDAYHTPNIIFPPNLKKLSINNYRSDFLPNSLKHLTISGMNDKLNLSLLTNLVYLKFDRQFNQRITDLPPNLEHLIFGWNFDHQITKYPPKLKQLVFGHKFNHELSGLPDSLTTLQLGYSFNKSIDNLPDYITQLTITGRFNQPVTKLPLLLLNLTLVCCSYVNKNTFNKLINEKYILVK